MVAYSSAVGPTGNASVDGLLSGWKWSVATLTYSFPSASGAYGFDYAYGDEPTYFTPFSAAQQAAATRALHMIEQYANLTFTQVAAGNGDLRFGKSGLVDSSGGAFAWAYYPGAAAGGDVWFKQSWTSTAPLGSFDYLSMIHELGHALGLKHSFEASGSFPQLAPQYDGNSYSVMSYDALPGLGFNVSSYLGSHPSTLMLFDIRALQAIYGANFGTNAGDTVYRWDPSTGQQFVNGVGQGVPEGNHIEMTVWDGGGFDTYDFSAYARSLDIDLNPGGWVTDRTLAGSQVAQFTTVDWAPGMIANAYQYNNDLRSLIEGANGGSGDDILTGNAASNRLIGGAGADSLIGGAGGDTLIGGLGADTLYGGANDDLLQGDKGADLLDGGDGIDTIDYSNGQTGVSVSLAAGSGTDGLGFIDSIASIENVLGSASADFLAGNAAANRLDGGVGSDTLQGGAGADRLYGGANDDLLRGDKGPDLLDGGDGVDTADYSAAMAAVTVSLSAGVASDSFGFTDTLTSIENVNGSAYADLLIGNASANRLVGGVGADTLQGGAGADGLIGGAGDDLLRGDKGADLLDGGDGIDTADYSNALAGVSANLAAGAASDGFGSIDTIISIENLLGSANGDVLAGDGSANRLEGGGGADQLRGNGGADVLVFRSGSGSDVIADFNAAGGAEHDILAFSTTIFSDFVAVQRSLSQVGSDVLIAFADGSVTLRNVDLAHIDQSDFLFFA